MRWIVSYSLTILTFLPLIAGCASSRQAVPTTHATTNLDPQTADPEFWYAKPSQHQSRVASFDTLWDVSEKISRNLLFEIDRRDRRNGILTTDPTVSPQWYEPWRTELQHVDDLADSSIATIRRTIRYEFVRKDDAYIVTPKVLIERQAIVERRVSGMLSKNYFRRDRELNAYGSRETDAGLELPDSYWYPIGRDQSLEAELVNQINQQLR